MRRSAIYVTRSSLRETLPGARTLCVWRQSGSGIPYALKSSDGLKKLLISSSPQIKLSGSGTTYALNSKKPVTS